ncbi:ribosomal L18 C-terminal region-domain-containing protein [Mycena galopus ATCC 62051]|nr:ribosomal L18 C-terminal region-domain-containing protein [Mycena galopus ATCC 62051]
MKGAFDGGIFIPHSEKRFPGYNPESKELDAEVLKKDIFGGHVPEYMESLEEEEDERFKKQFASYLTDGVSSEDIYISGRAAIREDPVFKPSDKSKDWKTKSVKHRSKCLTYAERKQNITAKIEKFTAGGDAAEADEEDNE